MTVRTIVPTQREMKGILESRKKMADVAIFSRASRRAWVMLPGYRAKTAA
jgi:hypothetical protein